MKKTAIILLAMLFLGIILTACVAGPSEYIEHVDIVGGKIQVDWYEINPPPGIKGPCYAYFEDYEDGGYGDRGFSGVWCSQ